MYTSKKNRRCSSFKPLDQDISLMHRQNLEGNCKDCVYFTSRNCGMDAGDDISPSIDILC